MESEKMESNDLAMLLSRREVLTEAIFKRLSASDLLNVSEVSWDFYNLVAKSPIAMNKIRLNIQENWDREFSIEDVEHSTRQYAHVKVESLFRRRHEVEKMLLKFSRSIVTIYTRFDFEVGDIFFPKLRALEISTRHPSSYVENGLMSAATNLVKLTLVNQTPFPFEIIKCLANNTGLEELVLEEGAQINVFMHLTHQICNALKLKLIRFNCFKDFNHYRELKIFLDTQRNSLKVVKLLNMPFEPMMDIYNILTNVKRLTYSPSDAYFQRYNAMKSNSSITDLILLDVEEEMLYRFLTNAPNLKKLFVAQPTWRMYEFIACKSPSLREFTYYSFVDRFHFNHTLKDAREYIVQQRCKGKYVNANLKVYRA
jgi:hypothetical protein